MTDLVVGTVEEDRFARAVRHAAVGAFVGGFGGVLAGLAARVAMRIFAERTQPTVSFTIEGTMLVVVLGVILGPALGVAYVAARSRLPGPALARGLVFGALIVVAIVAPTLLSQPGEAAPDPMLGVVLFAAIAVGFGVVIAAGVAVLDPRVARLAGLGGLVLGTALAGGLFGLMLLVAAMTGVYVSILRDVLRTL